MLLEAVVASALGAVAFLAPLAQAQVPSCLNGTLNDSINPNYMGGYFDAYQLASSWKVTIGEQEVLKSYALTCSSASDPSWGNIDASFTIPINKVAIMEPYSMTYLELLGKRTAIGLVQDPLEVTSPCIQQMIKSGTVGRISSQPTDIDLTNVQMVFVPNRATVIPKAFWAQHMEDNVDPLTRAEMIKLYSLIFNIPNEGTRVYNSIKTAFENIKASLSFVPDANKKRILWAYYADGSWHIKTTQFVMKMVQAAGGKFLGQEGEWNAAISPKTTVAPQIYRNFVDNADIVIDETDYGNITDNQSRMREWRLRSGYSPTESIKILEKWKFYMLDNEAANTISTYRTRVAARPDLLLMDLVIAQYPTFQGGRNMTFLRRAQYDAYTELTPALCTNPAEMMDRDIVKEVQNTPFPGDGTVPPPWVGCNQLLDSSCDPSKDNKKGLSTGVIVTVVIVAIVFASGFAFAFYKWNRKSKEEAFIELEDEMERDIPLRW